MDELCTGRKYDGAVQQICVPGFLSAFGANLNPIGIERHTIFCGLTSILWIAQIAEGKYRPQQFGQKEYSNLGGKR